MRGQFCLNEKTTQVEGELGEDQDNDTYHLEEKDGQIEEEKTSTNDLLSINRSRAVTDIEEPCIK